MNFELLHKPTFTNQLLALPKEYMVQVLEKVERLRQDPTPDGKVKKKLKGYKNNVYRLRSGDLRIIYTIAGNCVALLGVDDRKEVYRGQPLDVAGTAIDDKTLEEIAGALESSQPKPSLATSVKSSEEVLPRPITQELLTRLRIEPALFPPLLSCRTIEELTVVELPSEVLDRVFDAVMDPNFDLVVTEPSFVTGPTENLLRFKEGDLLGFLLKLDQEQERFVTWAVNATGPTLLKGGPGTGKSTVALYRAKQLLASLRESGIEPKILFTTYTNALVNFSKQLLQSLLGEDAERVEVRTADSIARGIFADRGANSNIASTSNLTSIMRSAVTATLKSFDGTQLQQQPKIQLLTRLTPDYLVEEVCSVIDGRGISNLDEYLLAPRAGRSVPLNKTQRAAVWELRQKFLRLLSAQGMVTWQQIRTIALNKTRSSDAAAYDGVIIDEAQDIEPNGLRLLVSMCRDPKRLFVTADANQSIYGSSFTWADVHEDLKFKGRTGVLKTNHRTTKEITEAAVAYLANGAMDEEEVLGTYIHTGPQPLVRSVATLRDEAELLVRFFKEATSTFRLGLSSCAVLVPTEKTGKDLAGSLTHLGVRAEFMTGKTLDLNATHVKVITLKSAKGLEFPIVAVAGFLGSHYPIIPTGSQHVAIDEIMARGRRTLFVGMTRSMRALLVVVPSSTTSPLLNGFDSEYWNIGAIAQ
jgi:superfamily I DNA/RNA helicase/mRNA-degrading endonuclease RelE of RelBE toxin-antitoxin system